MAVVRDEVIYVKFLHVECPQSGSYYLKIVSLDES